MKKLTPTLLATAIAIATAGSAQADTLTGNMPPPTPSYHYAKQAPVDSMHFQGPMTDAANWDGFIEGSHLSTWWRAAYFNYGYKHARKSSGATNTEKPDWKQAGLGGMIDWMSGYANGWFGMNASLYGGYKLDATGPGPADWLVRKHNNEDKYLNSYGRIGRLNAKFRFGDETNNILIHAGLVGADPEYLHSSLLSPEPHKLTYSSERGLTFKSNLCKFQIYGAYWDRMAGRAGNSLDRFSNGSGKNIDYVGMLGAAYTFPISTEGQKLYLNAEYAEGKSYVKEYFGQATYTLPFNEKVNMVANGQYYKIEKAGDLWTSGKNATAFTKDSHLANLNLTFNIDRFNIGGAYTKTKAKGSDYGITSNHFQNGPAANYGPSGYWGTSRQESDFDFDGENAYQMSAGYDFSDFAPGLSASLTQTYGNNINRNVGIKNETETNLAVTYYIPKVPGLWLDFEEAYYHSTSNNNTNAPKQAQRYNDFRVWVNYQVAIF